MGRFRSWLTRDMTMKDVILFVIAVLASLGFVNPIRRLAAVEGRVDKLESKVEFNSYLQCVQLRRSDPTLLPPGCAPIIDRQERAK